MKNVLRALVVSLGLLFIGTGATSVEIPKPKECITYSMSIPTMGNATKTDKLRDGSYRAHFYDPHTKLWTLLSYDAQECFSGVFGIFNLEQYAVYEEGKYI